MWKCDVISKMPHWLRIILGICKLINKINSIYQYLLIVKSNPFCYQICPRHTGSVFGTCTSALVNLTPWAPMECDVKCSSTLKMCPETPAICFILWTQEFLWLRNMKVLFQTWSAGAVGIRIPQLNKLSRTSCPSEGYTIAEIMTLVLCHIGSENRPFKWL